jgi:hypothetical protein
MVHLGHDSSLLLDWNDSQGRNADIFADIISSFDAVIQHESNEHHPTTQQESQQKTKHQVPAQAGA